MEIKMTEKRVAIMDTLRASDKAMTLAEIAKAMGVEKVATGTTNAMVKAGLIRKAGTIKVAKVIYVDVETYELGENADKATATATETESK